MTERVHLLGGKLRLESTPGEGTLVEAQLPL
jgi:signal transduction histidine kinase